MAIALLLALGLAMPPIDFTDPRAEPQAAAALKRLFTAYDKVQSLSYTMMKIETLRGGEKRREKAFVKFQKPGLIYLKALEPKEGQEVLYRPNVDPKKLTVHPGSFPDVTLSLDIQGGLATKKQRHIVAHSGFAYTLGLVGTSIVRSQKQPAGERFVYAGTRTIGGRKGDVVVLLAGTAPNRSEVAHAKESLYAFAKRVGQDPYVIYDANSDIDDLSDRLEEGKAYVVPAYYAHRTEMVIDPENDMLLGQVSINAAGNVFESFEYTNLVVNPTFAPNEFDPENPAYGF